MHVLSGKNNKEIEYNKFITAAISKKLLLTYENLEKAFEYLDCNKDGKISKEELENAFALTTN